MLLNQLYELFKLFCNNTFFLDEKSIQKNHGCFSFSTKLAKMPTKKELALLRQPFSQRHFNGFALRSLAEAEIHSDFISDSAHISRTIV